jgi:nucleotide-binding universal stress UspA family protein
MSALGTAAHLPAPTRVDRRRLTPAPEPIAPIVAAVDGSAASASAVNAAVRLGGEIEAPVVFVYVRRGPAAFLGTPFYQRRLTAAMALARRTLDDARRASARAGVAADGVILEGSPRRRIPEFARDRGARLLVVGRREHTLGRSVSRAVARSAAQPVVVARSANAPSPR